MKRTVAVIAKSIECLIILAAAVSADDWTTAGADAQRSGWVRADTKISPASVQSPEFELLWKTKFDNAPRHGSAPSAPVLQDWLIGHRGFRSLGFVAGTSGNVFVLDTDLALREWERPFNVQSDQGTAECPGGMTAGLTRPTIAALPALGGFAARGRRNPGKSGVGKPKEGAVTLIPATSRPASARTPTVEDTRTRPSGGRSNRGLGLVFALTPDGMLRSLYVSNGHDHEAPKQFVPPNANARGLIVVDNVAYVATVNGCGGVPDGIWALDLATDKVSTWKSTGGSIAGLLGPAIGPSGVVYAATEKGGLVALEAKTLKQLGSSGSIGFHSSPVVVDYNKNDYVAAVAADGSLKLFDGGNLSSAGATTKPSSNKGFLPGAVATWLDKSKTHWIVAPSAEGGKGAITTWKVVDKDGSPALEMGWKSSRIDSPLPPIIVNGIVFAVSGGRGPAKLHALDGQTGKSLWDSGSAITSAASGYALSAGPSHIYLSAADGTLYSFGIGIEH
jgi:hypothetical protein